MFYLIVLGCRWWWIPFQLSHGFFRFLFFLICIVDKWDICFCVFIPLVIAVSKLVDKKWLFYKLWNFVYPSFFPKWPFSSDWHSSADWRLLKTIKFNVLKNKYYLLCRWEVDNSCAIERVIGPCIVAIILSISIFCSRGRDFFVIADSWAFFL